MADIERALHATETALPRVEQALDQFVAREAIAIV